MTELACQECSTPIARKPGSGRSPIYCEPCRRLARARQQRAWHKNNPERSKQLMKYRSWKYLYGLSPEDAAALLAKGCAICGTHDDLSIDHDHVTGVIRDALCRKHNSGLGMFQDDTRLLLRAVAYLQKHDPSRASAAA